MTQITHNDLMDKLDKIEKKMSYSSIMAVVFTLQSLVIATFGLTYTTRDIMFFYTGLGVWVFSLIIFFWVNFRNRKQTGEKMGDTIKKYSRQILIAIGLACVAIAITCWIYAFYLFDTTEQVIDAAGYISIGLGFFSIGVAILSYKISKSSDDKMQDIGGSSFFWGCRQPTVRET